MARSPNGPISKSLYLNPTQDQKETNPMTDLLADYPVVIEFPIHWGEMDAFNHVNNVVYFRYFESGRIAYFADLDVASFATTEGVGPILASIDCKFKFPLTFPDTVAVGTKVIEVGEDRFTMRHRVVSRRHNRVAAEGDGVVVTFDYAAGRKAPIPALVRAVLVQQLSDG